MAKRMYAEVNANGRRVNMVVRATTEQEARVKLERDSNIIEIFEISPRPPKKDEYYQTKRVRVRRVCTGAL